MKLELAPPSMIAPRALWRGAAVAAAAVGVGLLLSQLLLRPPRADIWALAQYMALSSAATLALGYLALRGLNRVGPSKLQSKVALGTLMGAIIGLLNVLIIAKLMFISTAHDLRLLIALIGFSSLTSLGFSLWIASNVTRRLGEVTDAIRALARGELETQVAANGRDEVSLLATDVNVLAERLRAAALERADLDRERRDLTVAISHDLRTPLASIRAMAEALADGVVSEENERVRYYLTIRREVERLGRMVDDLFQLSQLDAGALHLERQAVALQEIAAEVVDAMQSRAAARGVRLGFSGDPVAPIVSVDGALMERAIGNLVANALEHTHAGGTVAVAVAAETGVVAVRVEDTGEGISPDDLPRVWDRFFRTERSRQRAAGNIDGAGLGLAIVRSVVEAHGGTVEAESAFGRGSVFTLRLPTAVTSP